MDFSTFKNKYVIKGELTVKTALHIGSGKEKDDRDAPFISLDDDKNFYIPGSSFRGYLSTRLERFLDSGNGFKIKSNGEELNEADVKLIFGYTNLDKEKNEDVKKRIIKKLKAEKLDEVKSLAGRIHISDMESLAELLGLALRDIMTDEGDLLGGKTSRGIGRCKLENLKMEYVKADDKEQLAKYIFTGKFPYEIKEQDKIFKTENLSLG